MPRDEKLPRSGSPQSTTSNPRDDAEPPVELHGAPSAETPSATIATAAAERDVLFEEIVRVAIDAHVTGDTTVERGGVLVGTVDDSTGTVRVTGSIRAEHSVSAPASLTFTHETWNYVNDVLAAEFEGETIVGWYHSHPGFGIFLSEYDTFIHTNFFSAPWHLAYVVDPLLDQSGLFGWEHGSIVRYRSWKIVARGSSRTIGDPERGPHEDRVGNDMADGRAPSATAIGIAAGLIALLVGLVIGHLTGQSTSGSASAETFQSRTVKGADGADVTVTRSWILTGDGQLAIDVVAANNGPKRIPKGTITSCAPADSTGTSTRNTSSSDCPLGHALEKGDSQTWICPVRVDAGSGGEDLDSARRILNDEANKTNPALVPHASGPSPCLAPKPRTPSSSAPPTGTG